MRLNEIENLSDEIVRSNLKQTLLEEYDLQVLCTNFIRLISLKNEFLLCNMKNYSTDDIETVRFKLVECIMNTKILIKELKGINTLDEIDELKKLFLMEVD
ncbi:hypothetical protein K9O30_15065 [Clostridium bowmanii]|uniref:hypothetical protein n=1 Tax=Clostridium bowmanii TaxID=132925 RepID=UPI001C0CB918|nr:hypothetical protein [Clostridium bowmanii]MBU3190736.1 hypothetical protein [Clostridium bowmanii]MCA1075018.1 hypothetical protein [Clostridium bowmanii]